MPSPIPLFSLSVKQAYLIKVLLLAMSLFSHNLAGQESKIDSLLKVMPTLDGESKAYTLVEISQLYWYSKPQEAIKYGLMAVKEAKAIQNPKRIGFALNTLGFAHNLSGDYVSAVAYLLEALQVFEQMDSVHLAARVYNNLGIVYLNQGNYAKAQEFFTFYLQQMERQDQKQQIAAACANLGVVYYRKEEFEKAIVFHNRYLALCEELQDEFGVSIGKSNLADVYKAQKDFEKALKGYEESLAVALKLDDTEGIILTKAGIASVMGEKGNAANALPLAKEALALAEKHQFRSYQQDTYKLLAELHGQLGQYQQAFAYQVRFTEVKDSVYSKQNSDRINHLQQSYEVAKKQVEIDLQETQIDLLNKEKALQNLINTSIIVGLLLAAGMAALQYRNVRIKQKAYKILKKQKEAIVEQKEEIEQQKEEILTQNEEMHQQQEEIMAQRDAIELQRTLLQKANAEIQERNTDMSDSIHYALRIQQAILPSPQRFSQLLPSSFVFFKPRDVVSGDFYWIQEVENRIVVAAVDCTGHGVPGAFMSMIGNELLNEIVLVRKVIEPEIILKEMNERIAFTLSQETSKNSDGMDMAVCTIHPIVNKVYFAGAKNSLIMVKDWQVTEIKGNRDSIGGHNQAGRTQTTFFDRHTIDYDANTTFYLTSDGFADQFGGEKSKKFGWKNLRNLFLEIHSLPAHEQQKRLESVFAQWQGAEKQIDDVMVLGFSL